MNEKEYGNTEGLFRGQWWNYYERGRSLAEGGFYPEAINDFNKAILARKNDQWRARTYGMHTIDYFPHREFGIVCYEQKRYSEAIDELTDSIRVAPSSKAKYFLNRARRQLLLQSGADTEAPSLQLQTPEDQTYTNASTVRLRGLAQDDHFVSSVTINGRPLFVELSENKLPIEEEIALADGINTISVQVDDLTGKSVKKSLTVIADKQGPVISISELKRVGARTHIAGFVDDKAAIATCTVNGKAVKLASKEVAILDSEIEGHEITVTAKDLAGNTTSATISLDEWLSGFQPHIMVACLEQSNLYASNTNKNFPVLYRADAGNAAPEIILRQVADFQQTFDDKFLIEGVVSDKSNIESFSINGEQILARKGKQVYFSQLQDLSPGKNVFRIEAVNTQGNRVVKETVVFRKEQTVRQPGVRMRIGILPLDQKGSGTAAVSTLYDGLISAFVSQKRFDIVERQRLEDVLRELHLTTAKLADPRTAVKLGKIAVADAILAGTIVETNDSVEIITRLIDSENSIVVTANDVFGQGKSLMAMNQLASALAFKYKKDFPLVEGRIIDASRPEVLVDLGQEKGIREHMKLLIFRDGPTIRHPASGRVLGTDTVVVGSAKVKAVFPGYSKVNVQEFNQQIKSLDFVITK